MSPNNLVDRTINVHIKDEVRLDKNNIRFRHLQNQMNEREIEEWLCQEEDVRTVYKQILLEGSINLPIYVVEDKDGKYIVKDGNRRIVALRKISREIQAGKITKFQKGQFDIVQVSVIKGTDRQIDIFLATIHVSGVKEWAAVNKAALVSDLIDKHGETFESVGQELGESTTVVTKRYKAYNANQRYVKQNPKDTNFLHKYSYFEEFYSSPALRNWIEEDQSRLDTFMAWIAQSKFSVTYRDVRKFAKIIAAPETKRTQCLKILAQQDGTVFKAYEFLTEDEKTSKKGGWKKLETIYKTLTEMSHLEMRKAVMDAKKQILLEDLLVAITRIKNDIKALQLRDGAAIA